MAKGENWQRATRQGIYWRVGRVVFTGRKARKSGSLRLSQGPSLFVCQMPREPGVPGDAAGVFWALPAPRAAPPPASLRPPRRPPPSDWCAAQPCLLGAVVGRSKAEAAFIDQSRIGLAEGPAPSRSRANGGEAQAAAGGAPGRRRA